MTALKRRNIRDFGFWAGMVLPGLGIFLLIVAYPVIRSAILGFTDYQLNPNHQTSFIGFTHYATMLNDDLFWLAFRNNMVVVAISVIGQIPLGLIFAYILHRRHVKGANFFQAVIFLPNFISSVIVGLLFKQFISPFGPIAQILQNITGDPTVQITWLQQPETAMFPIAIALIWMYTGFYMIIFLANLQRIDNGMIEAAQIDGASEIQIFLRIIVPMLGEVIAINAILAIAGSLKGFDLIWAMTGGGPANNTIVLPIYMYRYAFVSAEIDAYSFGSAISNLIVIISVVLILISNQISRLFKAYEEK